MPLRLIRTLSHPARAVPVAFLVAVLAGTLVLMLPMSTVGPGGPSFLVAVFTATSAVCVTGLSVVDATGYWSPFGQAMILLLVQVGGLGIMTGATLLGVLVSRRLQLSRRMIAQAETHALTPADVMGVMVLIVLVTFGVELLVWLVLLLRLRLVYGETWAEAAWNGLFHAICAFTNAGFSTYPDNLIGFSHDAALLSPIMLASIVGGLGFPVLYELRRGLSQPARWSVHTKITLAGTALLLLVGFAATLMFEWTNMSTLGGLTGEGKLLSALFHSVMTRSAGFNTVPVAELRSETLAVSNFLMFVGGGSAGTAGGIKVTTFFLLGFVVWAEIRGEADVTAFRRRISSDVQRDALTIALLAIGIVGLATLFLMSVSRLTLEQAMFEAISAFATVGLSTGVTGQLPPHGQVTILMLMFIGRVGTITFATALALRNTQRPFRYPEERPIVG